MTTAFAHEDGHALGLDHDRGVDGQGAACPMTVMNSSPNEGAPITSDDCRQADVLNDDTQGCVQWPATGSVNPCENPTKPPPSVNPPGSGGGFTNNGTEFNGRYSWAGGILYVSCTYGTTTTTSGGGPDAGHISDYQTTLTWHCDVAFGAAGTRNAPFVGPTISLVTPTTGQTVSGVINVSGWAMDFFQLTGVSFGIDHQQVQPGSLGFGYNEPAACQPPGGIAHSACNPNSGFAATLDTTKLSNGPHILSVVAMGHSGYPSALDRTIIVNNCTGSPSVSITSPLAGAGVSGAVPVTVSATDSAAISQVSLYVDGPVAATTAAAPYVFSWDTTQLAPGVHTLQSRVLDACGATAASHTVRVNVLAPVRMYVDIPGYGGTVSGTTVGVVGWASDPFRITSLAFRLDSQPLSLNAPYLYGRNRMDVCNAYPGDPNCPNVGWSASFDSTRFSNGAHWLSVTATDGVGQQATANWSINISNSPPPPPATSRLIWIQPEASAGYGPPGSFIVAGNATGGVGGGVQLWWRDVTTGGGWNLVSYAAIPDSGGTWVNAIPNVNDYHQYAAYAVFSGTTSRTCTYPGNNSLVWCP